MTNTDYSKLKKSDLVAEIEALNKQLEGAEGTESTQHLIHSEARYRALVEGSSDFIYVLDKEGRFTFANREIESLLGYTPEDITGKHFSEILHPADVDTVGHAFHERRTDERVTKRVEVRLNSRAGDTRNVEMDIRHFAISSSRLYSGEDYIGTHGVARDITERKYYEARYLALQQVREVVWNMIDSEDIQMVLEGIRRALETMGIPFHHCGVNILDMSDPPMLYSYSSYESAGIAKQGEWMISDAERFTVAIAEIWRLNTLAYRRDLDAEDAYEERESIAELYGPVRALVDRAFFARHPVGQQHRPQCFFRTRYQLYSRVGRSAVRGFSTHGGPGANGPVRTALPDPG
jgi:PAS domain S-box-containing protein